MTSGRARMDEGLSSSLGAAGGQCEQGCPDLIRQLIQSEENERRRLARRLHDGASQTLSALALGLNQFKSTADETERLTAIKYLQALAIDLETQLHAAAADAHPTALDDIGLAAALDSLVAGWTRSTGIAADFRCAVAEPLRVPDATQLTLYRCVREVLADIARHREAETVGVLLEKSGGMLRILIEEHARAPLHARQGRYFAIGPEALSARLSMVGASLGIATEQNCVRLAIELPLDPENPA